MDCVFCQIVAGEIPAGRVYEDERTLAIMDINPLNDGHLLVMPKTHVATLFEIAEDALTAVTLAVQRMALAVRATLQPDGLNLFQANGAAAFQSVPHFHIHVVPRWANDGIGLDWPLKPGDLDHIRAVGARIRAAMGS